MMVKLSIVLAVMPLAVANLAAQHVPTTEQQIAAATLPLPEAFRASATVQSISAELKITELRKGTGSMVCPIMAPGSETFFVQFERDYDALVNRRIQIGQELMGKGQSADATAFSAALQREIESGRIRVPASPAVGFQMRGPANAFDWNTNTPAGEIKRWEMIMIPNATGASPSLPNSRPKDGGPWVMAEGTPGAHIMIEH
jgi:hypothetical protein